MHSISLFILVAVSLCAAVWPANASLQCYECIGRDCEDWDKVPLVDCNLDEPGTTTPEDEISPTTESSSAGSESTGATGSTESAATTDATETTERSTTTAESEATTTEATEASTTTAESEATTTEATEASTTPDASTGHETSEATEATEATTDESTDKPGSSSEATPIGTTDADSTAVTQESSATEEASRPTEEAPTEATTEESSPVTEGSSESAAKATTESAAKDSPVHAQVQLQQLTLPPAGVRSGLARRSLAAQAADHLIRNYRALEQAVKYRTTACYSIVKDGTLHRGCVRIPEEQSACQAVREQVGLPENSVGDLCDVCQMDGCNGSASLRISLASLLLLLGLGLRGLL